MPKADEKSPRAEKSRKEVEFCGGCGDALPCKACIPIGKTSPPVSKKKKK